MAIPLDSTAGSTLEEQSRAVARRLVGALPALLDRLPGRPRRPQEVARLLGLNKNLSSRVMGALRQRDVLAALHHLPGPVPLRQLVQSAGALGVAKSALREAESAVDEFDEFVRREFGGLGKLQGYLGTCVPDARERQLATSKQAVFRGIAGIRGVELDAFLVAFVLHPAADAPTRLDTVVLNAFLGIRRSRPDAQFCFSTLQEARDGSGQQSDLLWPEFSSSSELEVVTERDGALLEHTLGGRQFGKQHSTDLAMLEHYERNHPVDLLAPDENSTRWFFAGIEHPSRLLVFDVLVHESVWPEVDPELVVYDGVRRRETTPDQPSRQADVLDLREEVVPFRTGDEPRCAEIPRYSEMIERLCADRGWDLSSFRGYRVQIAYPVYGSQVCLLFRHGNGPTSLSS